MDIRGLKRRGGGLRVFGALVCILKPTRRGRILQKGGFSLPGPILTTRSMWQFWASETPPKRLSNASVTLQKRSTSGLHVLLDVFIHCGRFHGQWTRRYGALLARVRVRLAAACATANPGFTPHILETPCLLKNIAVVVIF